jgi:hypothetical protein
MSRSPNSAASGPKWKKSIWPSINLSADNTAHADKLAELGIAPVVTVLVRTYARRAVRHRFKRRPGQRAETIGEWRDRTASLPRYTPAGRE